ncbi:MAG: response regulator [Alphaproteobacteria bacterium]
MPAKILVIDDDTLIRRMLCGQLEKLGYTVIEAATGQTGLVAFGKEKPALVITDVMMPDKNGLQAITEIRKMAPATKIIAMSSSNGTGQSEGDLLDLASDLGAAITLLKPFSATDIEAALKKLGV